MKILVINPNYQDATSYYRAWGVSKDLQERHGIEFTLYESTFVLQPPNLQGQRNWGASWPDLIKFDAVLFQRALGENSLQLLRYCKELGLKIWYDLDDDLWNIPDDYKIKASFPRSIMQTIEQHIQLSDLITCSTSTLSEVIKEHTNMHAHVVLNAWDVKRFPLQPHNTQGQTIWRGSNTHIDDIRVNREQIERIGKLTTINFYGHNPVKDRPFLTLHKHEHTKPLDPILYFRHIQNNRPASVLVPLKNSKFNASKSNIAWLEATANGAVTYSNGVGEFLKVGLKFEEYDTLSESQIKQYLQLNQDLLMTYYSLEVVNNQRAELIKTVLSHPYGYKH